MAAFDPEQSHDQNFKTIFVENPWAAITFALPKSVNFFRHEPEIEAIREETIKIYFSDSYRRMDVPLLAKYEQLAFIFLVEHQHDAHKFSIHHLARYVSHLEEQYECDVIPIVYFPNAPVASKTVRRETKSSFMGKRYHYFTYETVFLRALPAKKYLNSANIVARLLLPFMHYSRRDWIEVLDSALKGVLDLVDPVRGLRRSKYLDFVLHYFNLEASQWETFRAYKHGRKEDQEVEMITSILKKQGWEEGKFEGKLEGRLEAERDMLLVLLSKRFGAIPPDVEAAIRSSNDVERIHDVLVRFLEIKDWQELRELLNENHDQVDE